MVGAWLLFHQNFFSINTKHAPFLIYTIKKLITTMLFVILDIMMEISKKRKYTLVKALMEIVGLYVFNRLDPHNKVHLLFYYEIKE